MIYIVTDSTSDISQEAAKELDIRMVSLPVYFGNEVYKNISNEEFYDKLSKVTELPTTSQINPNEFEELFSALLQSPEDEVVGIFISSELSGTYQSAVIAKNTLDDERIHLIDSKNATFGLAILVYEAVKLREMGYHGKEIADDVKNLVEKVRLYALVDTLKYLKMGGRISSATAIVGGVLGINPLISIVNGKVESVGKTRGRKGGFRWMEQQIEKDDPDFSRLIAFGHTNDLDALQQCMDYFEGKLNFSKTYRGDIGSVVGTHVGSGAVGIAYFVK